MTNTELHSTPPELFHTYEAYVRSCIASRLEFMNEGMWTNAHQAYLDKQPKTLEQRVTDLERRMNEWEGD